METRVIPDSIMGVNLRIDNYTSLEAIKADAQNPGNQHCTSSEIIGPQYNGSSVIMFGLQNQRLLLFDGCSIQGTSYGEVNVTYNMNIVVWLYKGLEIGVYSHPETINSGPILANENCLRLDNDTSRCDDSGSNSSGYGDFLGQWDRNHTYNLCKKDNQFRFSKDCSNFEDWRDPFHQFAGASSVLQVQETKDNISFSMQNSWTIASSTPPADCPIDNTSLNPLPGVTNSPGGCQYTFTNPAGTDNYTFVLRHIDNRTLVDDPTGSTYEPNPFLLIEEFKENYTPPSGQQNFRLVTYFGECTPITSQTECFDAYNSLKTENPTWNQNKTNTEETTDTSMPSCFIQNSEPNFNTGSSFTTEACNTERPCLCKN